MFAGAAAHMRYNKLRQYNPASNQLLKKNDGKISQVIKKLYFNNVYAQNLNIIL